MHEGAPKQHDERHTDRDRVSLSSACARWHAYCVAMYNVWGVCVCVCVCTQARVDTQGSIAQFIETLSEQTKTPTSQLKFILTAWEQVRGKGTHMHAQRRLQTHTAATNTHVLTNGLHIHANREYGMHVCCYCRSLLNPSGCTQKQCSRVHTRRSCRPRQHSLLHTHTHTHTHTHSFCSLYAGSFVRSAHVCVCVCVCASQHRSSTVGVCSAGHTHSDTTHMTLTYPTRRNGTNRRSSLSFYRWAAVTYTRTHTHTEAHTHAARRGEFECGSSGSWILANCFTTLLQVHGAFLACTPLQHVYVNTCGFRAAHLACLCVHPMTAPCCTIVPSSVSCVCVCVCVSYTHRARQRVR